MFGFIKESSLQQYRILVELHWVQLLLSAASLKWISMNNQESKLRPEIVNVNSDEPEFYPFKTSKCSGRGNNVNDPYANMCVPDVIKSMNVKVFNLMPRTKETRHIKWHETCICKCRLAASVCNNKQRCHEDKCRCECKEVIDKGVCDKGFIWNPSNCECKCDKSLDVEEYSDYENCKCRRRLVYKLNEECTDNVEEAKIAGITLAEHENKHKNKCSTFALYIFSNLYNQHWSWYLFHLLQVHEIW